MPLQPMNGASQPCPTREPEGGKQKKWFVQQCPYRFCLLYLTLLLGWNTIYAQNISNAVFYTLTEKEGLTDNRVNCFYQDSRGVMWMGTNYGLNSYDGSIIINYHASPNTLTAEAINEMAEDEQQTLWLATGGGLTAYHLRQKTFQQFRFSSTDEVLNRFYSLSISGGNIYLATEAGLVVFEKNKQIFTRYLLPDAGSSRITKLLRDRQHRLWLGSYNGVWLFNEQKKRFTCYNSKENDAEFSGFITDIFEDHNGEIWFGSWTNGLKKLLPDAHTVQNFYQYKSWNGNTTSITEQRNADGRYSLWQSSTVCRINTTAHTFEYLQTGLGTAAKPIISNRLFCDRDNTLWMSTNEGIKIYNPGKQYFRNIILSSFVPLTSQGMALLPLQKGFMMGGEGSSSLSLYNDSINLVKNLSSVAGSAAIMNIQTDAAGNYWCCTANGLLVLDKNMQQPRRFLHADTDPASLPKNFLNYTLFLKNGDNWIMPWRKGVWRADVINGKFYRVSTKLGDTLLPDGNLSKAIEDANGNIWIADYSAGLFQYNLQTGTVNNLIKSCRLSNIWLLGNQLFTVTAREIFAVDIHTSAIRKWFLPEGKNKYEYDFIPDGKGYLWIATKTGLLAFNINTGRFKNFTEGDGLYSNNMELTMAQLTNGQIIMAAGTYITVFDPEIVHQMAKPSPILFTGLWVDGKEKPLNQSSVQIAWNERNISFNWALLNFANPLGNTYYYKLDGVDTGWKPAGNKGQVSFNSLAPGHYTFHYKATTSDGVESAEQTIQLVVHPPYWKRWWFILLSVAIISLLFYLVVRYISQRNLKERLLKLEKEQAVEKERNRISRDMHDDLGSGLTKIAILSEVVKTQPEDAQKNVDKISETARNLVDNLDEMVWALNPKNDSLDKLMAYIAEYTHQYLEGTGIEPRIQLPEQPLQVHIGEEKRRNIFMAVKEFLNNSVKHSNAKNIELSITQTPNSFSINIKDDGRGMDMNALSGMGNGLTNMQQRVKDVGGTATLHSEPGNGASLQIICPV